MCAISSCCLTTVSSGSSFIHNRHHHYRFDFWQHNCQRLGRGCSSEIGIAPNNSNSYEGGCGEGGRTNAITISIIEIKRFSEKVTNARVQRLWRIFSRMVHPQIREDEASLASALLIPSFQSDSVSTSSVNSAKRLQRMIRFCGVSHCTGNR